MTDFFRFPRTPHLAWLAPGEPRGDKLLPSAEVRELLAHPVVIEEKLDGANLGISLDADGSLQVQNRGALLAWDSLHPQFKPLRHWIAVRQHSLTEALSSGLTLFGEWCYATHSIRYTRLPDWFIAFDVYERKAGKFWSVDRRNKLVRDLTLAVVPEIDRGTFDLHQVRQLLGPSRLTDGPAEGVYVRWDDQGFLGRRAKLVRGEFAQAIGEHWSRGPLQLNELASHRRKATV